MFAGMTAIMSENALAPDVVVVLLPIDSAALPVLRMLNALLLTRSYMAVSASPGLTTFDVRLPAFELRYLAVSKLA